MQKCIIGKKIGMTQIFDETGKVIPVTVVEAGPCVVSQKKTVENDGYASIQIGFGDLKAHKVNKPMKGHFAKADVAPKRYLREFRVEDTDAYNVGDQIFHHRWNRIRIILPETHLSSAHTDHTHLKYNDGTLLLVCLQEACCCSIR